MPAFHDALNACVVGQEGVGAIRVEAADEAVAHQPVLVAVRAVGEQTVPARLSGQARGAAAGVPLRERLGADRLVDGDARTRRRDVHHYRAGPEGGDGRDPGADRMRCGRPEDSTGDGDGARPDGRHPHELVVHHGHFADLEEGCAAARERGDREDAIVSVASRRERGAGLGEDPLRCGGLELGIRRFAAARPRQQLDVRVECPEAPRCCSHRPSRGSRSERCPPGTAWRGRGTTWRREGSRA